MSPSGRGALRACIAWASATLLFVLAVLAVGLLLLGRSAGLSWSTAQRAIANSGCWVASPSLTRLRSW